VQQYPPAETRKAGAAMPWFLFVASPHPIPGLAKCKWSKRRLGAAAVRVAVGLGPPLFGRRSNQTSSRGKRARTKPIGIALAFLGQCDDSLCDESFAVSRPLLRSVWYAFSDAIPIARVSSGPNTKSRTREETVPIGLLSLSGGSAIGLSATGAWAVAGGDIMMSVPVQDPAFAEARIAIAARIVTPRESGRDVSVWS
jgi:hypothetical protein